MFQVMNHYYGYEQAYKSLLKKILKDGELRTTRNAKTKAIFGANLTFDCQNKTFPLLTSRKMFYKGVLGELAAMLRGPKHLSDFEKFGCNYWKTWAKEDGSLNVDYGNTWIDFNGSGVNQLKRVIDTIKSNPTDRRLLVIGSNPQNLEVSLPSCHVLYQWFVREGKYLDMLWYQRSADTVLGVPSDAILAQTLNMLIAKDTGLIPGMINMIFGDTHIYENHFDKINEYIYADQEFESPTVRFADSYIDIWNFKPEDLIIENYQHGPTMKFDLLA